MYVDFVVETPLLALMRNTIWLDGTRHVVESNRDETDRRSIRKKTVKVGYRYVH